ncbi:MAG: hypothetical protein MUP33_05930 [Polaromonas sp.]|nr:hypothetical protein [Polaromonas sp.]
MSSIWKGLLAGLAATLVLSALMFFGRLGPVTLMLSIAQLRDNATYSYPEEQILVG